MIAIALALSLTSPLAPLPAHSPNPVGRLYTSDAIHLGFRSAVLVTPDEWGIGFTFQISTKAL